MRIYGKLNIFLNVGSKVDGFHGLESVFAPCVDIFDDVQVALCDEKSAGVFFSVSDYVRDFGSQDYVNSYEKSVRALATIEDNAGKAVRLFAKKFGAVNLRVDIAKGIPFLAGMGGSSADAVGVLKCLCEMTGKGFSDVADICDMIGSDLAGMWSGGVNFCTGRGDVACEIACALSGFAVVCVPNFGVSTRAVFEKFDGESGGKPQFHYRGFQDFFADFFAGDNPLCNNLQDSAFAVSPQLESFSRELHALSGAEFLMTGSGSGMFCLVRDRETAERICESVKGVCGFCAVSRL